MSSFPLVELSSLSRDLSPQIHLMMGKGSQYKKILWMSSCSLFFDEAKYIFSFGTRDDCFVTSTLAVVSAKFSWLYVGAITTHC